jgi:uncharacterized protein (DUF362 family)
MSFNMIPSVAQLQGFKQASAPTQRRFRGEVIMSYDFPGKGKVSVLKTKPETVLDDIGQLVEAVDYQQALSRELATILKVNISSQTWYPASSTNPWQLEGVIRQLQRDGYERLIAGHNDAVAVDAYAGERNIKHKYVVDKYGVENVHLYEPHVEWITYEPKAEMLVLHDIFPEGIQIPRMFIGKNIIHLPTVKTHVLSTIAGAMNNAFGSFLNHRRHWTHAVIHETLVDLLAIQREIHPGIFAVMDGTFAGDGPGPRAMRPHERDILLASADQVSIDAISARLQGFDPMELDFIRLAHEKGLGIGDPNEIEIVGYDISLEEAWNFVHEDTFASAGKTLTSTGPPKNFEKPLLHSPVFNWSRFASNVYLNVYWYPFVGRKRVKEALKTRWGRLFKSYDDGRAVLPRPEPRETAVTIATIAALIAVVFLVFSRLFRR